MKTLIVHCSRWLISIGLVALVPGTLWAATVAMVLDVQGKVTASLEKRPVSIGIAVSLQDGTEVTLADGGRMVLTHYSSKANLSFDGPAQFIVGAKEVKKLSGAAPRSRQLPTEVSRAAQGFKGRIVPAAMVMKGVVPKVTLQQPVSGESVPGDQFEVLWTSEAAEVRFRITEAGKLRGEKSISSQRFPLSEVAALSPGKRYRLIASTNDKDTEVSFSVLSKGQQSALQRLRPADKAELEQWVVYAMALEQAGAVSSAKAVWRLIVEQRQGAGERLGELAE